MKPGAGKKKGNGFEDSTAKKLSKALQPLNFMRSPGSGARVGGKNFATMGQMFGEDALKLFVADVVPINEKDTNTVFLWSIECKSYKTQDNFTSLVSGSANIFKWFKESVEDAKKINKEPMLIFKWNHTPTFVIVDLASIDPSRHTPLIWLSQPGENSLAVFEFETLLKDQSFWFTPAVSM